MASPKSPSCSLFVIPARKARRAVIFRRGPSRQVRLISWNLEDDSFQRGQWLKGRVYERRADLSPSGAFLVYFAGKQKAPHPTWTAVSRPPFLTALAFWPKGDTWGGGGLFLTEYKLQLDNHCAPTETKGLLQLSPFDRATGVHEHERVWGARLLRDGWHRLPAGIEDQDPDAPVLYAYNPPVIFARPAPKAGKGEAPVLEMLLHGALQKDGPFYRITHRLRLDDEVVLGLATGPIGTTTVSCFLPRQASSSAWLGRHGTNRTLGKLPTSPPSASKRWLQRLSPSSGRQNVAGRQSGVDNARGWVP